MQTNALVDHAGFQLWAAIHWSHISWGTPALWYIIRWRPCTSIRLQLHPMACCFLLFLLPVLRIIFDCASRVMFWVAAFAVLGWTMGCLHCSWVSAGGVLVEPAVILLDSVPLSPHCFCCGAMICLCGSEKMMMMKQSGKSWGRR